MDKKQQHVSNSINNLPLYSQRQHPLDRHIGQQQSNKAVLCFTKHARCEVALDLRIDWRYTVGIERPYNICLTSLTRAKPKDKMEFPA